MAQNLTGHPRESLSADAVRSLLTADSVTVSAGLDLLDGTNTFVEDISDDLVSGSVSWDNRNAVHGSCRLAITRQLAWGRDRVRPFMVLSDGVTTARFNLGVFVLTAPDTTLGEDPITYVATGYDLTSLLQNGPANTYTVVAGTTYIAAARAVLTASGIGSQLLVDGTLQDKALPATRVWALTEPAPSWLRILTDLFGEINYERPWPDEDGNIHSRPFQPVDQRPVDWALDTSDERTNIVGEDRTLSVETGDIANWWKFIRTDREDPSMPTEGDGIYTPPPNQSDGPTSIDALGGIVRKVVRLTAADQASLVAQGDKIVAQDKAAVRTINLSIDPLPIMGFGDVFQYTDAGSTEKIGAASWTINLDGSPGQLQLGGAPAPAPDPVEQQTKATITAAAPLRVVVDGATTDSFATALNAAVYNVGDRVTVTVRNPLPPMVQGAEYSAGDGSGPGGSGGGGGTGAVESVNGKTGVVVLSATDVGAATPTDVTTASTADRARANHTGTQATSTITGLDSALAAKAPLASPTFTGTVSGVTKAMVGLGSVDNTSDAAKPVSTATQTALNGKAATSHTHAQADVTGLVTALAGKVDNAAGQSLTIWTGTEAQYNAIGTKSATTIYFRTA